MALKNMISHHLDIEGKSPHGLTEKKYLGLMLGAITGDCLGLPFEMLPPARKKKIYGVKIDHQFLNIPFIGRFGICSDDTEHVWMTATALCKSSGHDLEYFGHELSKQLKYWLLTCPIGLGRATLLSCLKLLMGWHHSKSGIFSAGNGAAVRALIIGAFYSDNTDMMLEAVRISTAITHADPRAFEGALAIAVAAGLAMHAEFDNVALTNHFFDSLFPLLEGEELRRFLDIAREQLSLNSSLTDYLKCLSIGERGISGYINHTVAAVIYAWLRYYGDYRETVSQIISAGGDTDTTAALAGALSGLTVGQAGLPKEWLDGACGWPLTFKNLCQMSHALTAHETVSPPSPFGGLFFIRNMLSIPIFGFHIFRRLIRV